MFYRLLLIILSATLLTACTNSSTATPTTTNPSEVPADGAQIKVTSPRRNETIKSPYKITGEARGSYYFEGSFPIKLLDDSDQVIATTIAKAKGDWMTDQFVPFTATLTFTPKMPHGFATLVFSNDNPSGNPATSQEFRLPVNY